MKLRPWSMFILIGLVFAGGITAAKAAGIWKTSGTRKPAQIQSGKFKGSYDPADIRGSFTLADIADSFLVSVAELAEAFGIPGAEAEQASYALKNLEKTYAALAEQGMEIGTSSVRTFTAYMAGLPIVPEGYLPERAVEMILAKNNSLTSEERNWLTEHTVSRAVMEEVLEGAPAGVSGNAPGEVTGDNSESRQISGKTTFRNLLDWGVSRESIEQVLGTAMQNPVFVIRDYCTDQALSFSAIKEALQALVPAD